MIDTIVFCVYLAQIDINLIKFFLKRKIMIDNYTGMLEYEFTTGDLKGSFDYRIRIAIKDKICKAGKWESCPEFIEFEFSLSKFATGFNLTNCSIIEDAIRISIFRRWFHLQTTVELPDCQYWILRRLDVAYNIDCHSRQNAQLLIDCFKKLRYPRREESQNEVKQYKTSVYYSGETTTFKIYMKYSEFKAHDLKRVTRFFRAAGMEKEKQKQIIDEFTAITEGILRFEIGFKRIKLKSMKCNSVADIFNFDWEEIMKTDYQKFQKGAVIGKVYKSADVFQKIQDNYIVGQGISSDAVFSVWNILSNFPEKAKKMNRMKKKRAQDVLKRLGIACISTSFEIDVPEEIMTGSMFFPFFKAQDCISNQITRNKIEALLPLPLNENKNINRDTYERNFPIMYRDYVDIGVFDGKNNEQIKKAA